MVESSRHDLTFSHLSSDEYSDDSNEDDGELLQHRNPFASRYILSHVLHFLKLFFVGLFLC